MCFIPVPGSNSIRLEPGNNFAAWIDSLLLEGHMWKYTKTWDPEGIFSTLPAIATGLIGCITGQWLQKNFDSNAKLVPMFVCANILILSGLAWGMIFPINKSLWTSSYVLYTAGIALHALSICYWLIDILKIKTFTPFFFSFGSNAITAYVLSELLTRILYIVPSVNASVWESTFKFFSFTFLPLEFLSLLFAMCYVAFIYIPVRILYNRKIFIKV